MQKLNKAQLNKPIAKQKGIALIIFALILVFATITFLVSQLDGNGVKIERDKKTAAALAEAKSALIGYAAGIDLPITGPGSGARPGDLPCPDNHSSGTLEGTSSTPCNANALGRLPWKTLGIADLRDGSGERLWYAVSINFKNSSRTSCTTISTGGCLNSDTNGTITVRDSTGAIINDGSSTSAAIAVVIAPNSPLQRQDGLVQNRSAANYNAANHFLDNTAVEDNSNFVNGGLNGFINGELKNASQQVIVNDRMMVISKQDLMPLLEKRVANEVLRCMNAYASAPVTGVVGTYPWPAQLNTASPPSYVGVPNNLFGRLPSSPMGGSWSGGCSIAASGLVGWWLNWREIVVYAVADGYKPTASSPACGTCLTVSLPSAAADKRIVVLVAGQIIGSQARNTNAKKGTLSNYLEAANSLGGTSYLQQNATPAFNDVVVYR